MLRHSAATRYTSLNRQKPHRAASSRTGDHHAPLEGDGCVHAARHEHFRQLRGSLALREVHGHGRCFGLARGRVQQAQQLRGAQRVRAQRHLSRREEARAAREERGRHA
jgi:hypothetical protein